MRNLQPSRIEPKFQLSQNKYCHETSEIFNHYFSLKLGVSTTPTLAPAVQNFY